MAISTRTIKAILNKQRKAEEEAKKSECNKASDKLKVKLKSWLKKEFDFGRYDFTIGVYVDCSELDRYNASKYSIHVTFFKGDQYKVCKKFMEKFGDFEFKGFKCHSNCSGNYENPCCNNWLVIDIYNK